MKTIIIIPARYKSSRYPGKPLVDLNLPNGEKKSLIELTWLTASKVKNINKIVLETTFINHYLYGTSSQNVEGETKHVLQADGHI